MSAWVWAGIVVLGLLAFVAAVMRLVRVSDENIERIRLFGDRDRQLERQIVHMAKEGFSVARIARELGVSPNTVKALMDRMVLAHGHRAKSKG